MKIKDYKCKCEHDDFFFSDKGNQTGIYCSYCGKWFKWADKDEQNLRMKQGSTLDKIETEIKKLPDMDEAGVFSSVRMKKMVLEIFDKYKEREV